MSDDEESEERIKIMALGNSKVGKTSFITKYTDNTFQDVYLATIGIDFKIKNIVIKEIQYKLFFYDTTGQEKYRSMALNMIKNAHGIILMYDITDKSSFDAITEWIKSIHDLKGKNFPVILLGNKIDLEDGRVISQEEGKKLADEYKIEFFETSNIDGTNINEAGLAIVNKILDSRQRISILDNNSSASSHSSKVTIKTKNKKKGKSKKCC